jgi:hypothetical protein
MNNRDPILKDVPHSESFNSNLTRLTIIPSDLVVILQSLLLNSGPNSVYMVVICTSPKFCSYMFYFHPAGSTSLMNAVLICFGRLLLGGCVKSHYLE